jgi:hypothetical protein
MRTPQVPLLGCLLWEHASGLVPLVHNCTSCNRIELLLLLLLLLLNNIRMCWCMVWCVQAEQLYACPVVMLSPPGCATAPIPTLA